MVDVEVMLIGTSDKVPLFLLWGKRRRKGPDKLKKITAAQGSDANEAEISCEAGKQTINYKLFYVL